MIREKATERRILEEEDVTQLPVWGRLLKRLVEQTTDSGDQPVPSGKARDDTRRPSVIASDEEP
jgi:hypothetical protein